MKEHEIHIEASAITIGRYMRYAMTAYMKKRWWLYVLPLVACCALSVININFLFVAIVLLFLVFTMILFIVVIYYGLVPESRFSTLPKEITLDDSGITFRLKKRKYEENNDDADDVAPKYDIEEAFLSWREIKGLDTKDDCLLFLLKQPKFSFVAIPYADFTSEIHLRSTVSLATRFI